MLEFATLLIRLSIFRKNQTSLERVKHLKSSQEAFGRLIWFHMWVRVVKIQGALNHSSQKLLHKYNGYQGLFQQTLWNQLSRWRVYLYINQTKFICSKLMMENQGTLKCMTMKMLVTQADLSKRSADSGKFDELRMLSGNGDSCRESRMERRSGQLKSRVLGLATVRTDR